MTPERRIARYIADSPRLNFTAAATATAKRSLVDGMAALAAGRRADGIEAMLGLSRRWGGAQEVRAFGAGEKFPAPRAAWLNGAMMRALELDDCTDTLPLHPTAAVLPAILAIAEIAPVTGAGLLRALVVAQDLKVRFGLAVKQNAVVTGRNNLFRIYAATAGAAAALCLDEETTLHALGLSGSYTGSDAQCVLEGAMALRVQFGNTAHGAVQSVLLAQAGVTGPRDFLMGRYGYFNAFEPDHDIDALLGGLGERFEGERITVKPFAACRCTHAAIDLAAGVTPQLGGDPLDVVKRIDITVSPEVDRLVGSPRSEKLAASTSAAAQFSMNFTTAAALLTGRFGLTESAPERLHDPRTAALAERIHVIAAPNHRTDNIVGLTTMRIELTDGRRLEVSSAIPPGGPQAPITPRQLAEKLADCAAYGGLDLSRERASTFIARCGQVEAEPVAARLFDDFA